MQSPPIPVDEDQRLADLRRLDLPLTTPEESFDSVARELARIFDVPGAAITFMDRDVQYNKATVSLDPNFTAPPTEPRELSVCSFVVGQNDMVVVEDLLADDRFRDNPMVLESGARFYAGAPLRADSGRALGSVCIVDVKPRSISQREQELLLLVAQGVMAHANLQVSSRQLLQRTQQIERDLQQAVQTQRYLLPQTLIESRQWQIRHFYRPVEHLGGDFVDVHRQDDGRCTVLVADVSGHGTTAALIGAMTKTAFHRAAPSAETPAQLLSAIHGELMELIPPGQFLTALAAIAHATDSTVTVASAGHPFPIRVGPSGAEIIELNNELVLWVDSELSYENHTTITLQKNERLLLYTDGAIEAANPENGLLGAEGLCCRAVEVAAGSSEDFLVNLFGRISQHSHDYLTDDVALVTIERR